MTMNLEGRLNFRPATEEEYKDYLRNTALRYKIYSDQLSKASQEIYQEAEQLNDPRLFPEPKSTYVTNGIKVWKLEEAK